MKQKKFTKKQLQIIKRLEKVFEQAGNAGLGFFGQCSNINYARQEILNYVMNRDDPFIGKEELLCGTLNLSRGIYHDSGADDILYFE